MTIVYSYTRAVQAVEAQSGCIALETQLLYHWLFNSKRLNTRKYCVHRCVSTNAIDNYIF